MSVKAKEGVEKIEVFIPARSKESLQEELGNKTIIKLGANESRLGFSPKIAEALKQQYDDLYLYPDPGCGLLRETLAKYHNVDEDNFAFGNGSFELIQVISQAYLEKDDEVILPSPSFGWYAASAKMAGNKAVGVGLNPNHETDLDAIYKAINEHTKIIWLCNPNNPTGKLIPKDDLLEFVERVPSNILLVIDEAYIDFVPKEYGDSVSWIKEHDNLVILRTFSKLYGLASMRIGYAIANPDIVANINRMKQPMNIGRIPQIAANVAISDEEFKKKVFDNNREGLEYYYSVFDKWGLEYIKSDANFLMVNIKADADQVEQKLIKQGILIRNAAMFGYKNWLRITVGTKSDNEALISALANILGYE